MMANPYWPLGILGICVTVLILLIVVVRANPFIALLLSAVLAGVLASELPGDPGHHHAFRALELSLTEFLKTANSIWIVIVLASIIGVCLMESGAAETIVRRLLSWLGMERAGTALLASGFFLGIPVFFDTVFFLLIPLARALSLRSSHQYLFFVLVICGGAVITHSLVAPTPGPLMMADTLQLDLGFTILAGIAAGLLPAAGVMVAARWLNQRSGISAPTVSQADAAALVNQSDDRLPPFALSLLPVLVPVVLIASVSFYQLGQTYYPQLGSEAFAPLKRILQFLGNRNIAMLIGTLFAIGILIRQKPGMLPRLPGFLRAPLRTAVLIILITSAGGAFGGMIRHAGVGGAIETAIEGRGMNFILLAWLLSTALKIAQGSGTVAMITTSAMMVSLIEGTVLPYHPVYIFLAIGFGSMTVSWMNDSAFWVVGKLSGLTVKQTLGSWTLLLALISVFGVLQLLVMSTILPLAPR